MRLYAAIATVLLLLACVSATENDVTRSLTTGRNGGTKQRLLRSTHAGEERGAVSTVGNLAEKAKFRFWKLIGDHPGVIHEKWFKNMDAKDILASPKRKVWSRYEEWYNKKTWDKIKAAANTAN
ncbi:hypothetical protein PHYSODRAFT_284487 [Phytophthora sojae]|uniref:RxLR effector protein n=2 Tax=Phytophthora sojae TaxID=67593 RepID=G4YE32_PHYSP|nr:hypothetical protein PHYSODRAFT_284487 [Phytophthora sojae]AEK81079.1 Avh269 [Phytophthora sojae]AEK81081.1 Avh269 [Phytophthora sojae]EGZ29613.1 hypothetical protein PHYSODRAFT_284487 [Phytophthora sojae]|eukprot:XP_009516888.1 hypothetical protein PHYSODRAFT_284487 [Phytophthora sojae]